MPTRSESMQTKKADFVRSIKVPCSEIKNHRFQVSVDRWILIVRKRSRYQKISPWSEVFFGHIFGALRRTPYTQSAKNSFAGHFENPQFSVLSASEHLQRPEMYPHHQDFFYLVKLYDKKLHRKYLVPRNTPRTPTSNQKIVIFDLLTKLRPPKSRGRECRSAKVFSSQKQLVLM